MNLRSLLSLSGLSLVALASAQLRVGSFDSTRGGGYSFSQGSLTSVARAELASAFPALTWTSTSTLDATFFSQIDILLLSSATSNSAAVTPLTGSEQTALMNFVNGGGSAVLFVENVSSGQTAHESLVSPYGLHINFNLSSMIGRSGGPNPIWDGPFGSFTAYQQSNGSVFTSTGTSAVLGRSATGSGDAVVAMYDRGAWSASSGMILFNGDSTFLSDAMITASGKTYLKNAIAYAVVPEPVSSAALLCGVAGLLARARRRRARTT